MVTLDAGSLASGLPHPWSLSHMPQDPWFLILCAHCKIITDYLGFASVFSTIPLGPSGNIWVNLGHAPSFYLFPSVREQGGYSTVPLSFNIVSLYTYAYRYACVGLCMCGYQCACTCVYTCMYVCMHVHAYVEVGMCVCICVHVYVCAYACVYTYVCVHACVCVYVDMYMYVCICVYVYVYAHAYV